MTDRKKSRLVETLQGNVSGFFDNFHKRYASEMSCAQGCAKCCRVQLEIFSIEAQRILNWWLQLKKTERNLIAQSWKFERQGESPNQLNPKDCVFLIEQKCSVYPARPIICRSQGLPLRVKSIQNDELAEDTYELSLCELNFTSQEKLPQQAEWLDLDRLNTLLALAQRSVDRGDICAEVESLENSDGRVSLRRLKELLLRNLD